MINTLLIPTCRRKDGNLIKTKLSNPSASILPYAHVVVVYVYALYNLPVYTTHTLGHGERCERD